MSFVGHIEVKESPSKILKLINCIFICIFSATERSFCMYNTRSGSFSELALQNNKRKQYFDPAFEKSTKRLSSSRQLNTLEDTGQLRN